MFLPGIMPPQPMGGKGAGRPCRATSGGATPALAARTRPRQDGTVAKQGACSEFLTSKLHEIYTDRARAANFFCVAAPQR
jgi:hypothetical protein